MFRPRFLTGVCGLWIGQLGLQLLLSPADFPSPDAREKDFNCQFLEQSVESFYSRVRLLSSFWPVPTPRMAETARFPTLANSKVRTAQLSPVAPGVFANRPQTLIKRRPSHARASITLESSTDVLRTLIALIGVHCAIPIHPCPRPWSILCRTRFGIRAKATSSHNGTNNSDATCGSPL